MLAAVALSAPSFAADMPLSFSLDEAIERALRANRQIRNASSSTADSRLALETALSTLEWKVFPGTSVSYTGDDDDDTFQAGLELSARKSLSQGGTFTVTPGVRGGSGSYLSSFRIALAQPLLKGLGTLPAQSTVDGASFALRTALRSFYLRQVDLVLSTVSSYYTVIRQEERMRLQRELVERLRGHAESAEAKKKHGLASPIDVFRARIELKQAEDTLLATLESRRRAFDELKLLLALPLEEEIAVDSSFEYTPVLIEEKEALETSFLRRVELEQAADEVRESERRSLLARNGALPDLTLSSDYTRSDGDEEFRNSFGFSDSSWGLRLTSSTDWARKAEQNEFTKSLNSLERARRSLDERRDEIAKQLKSELYSLGRLEERIVVQRERIGDVRGQLELAKVKYRHGRTGNFDVIEAETRLEEAQAELVSAIIDYIVGTYRLRGALGTLLEAPSELKRG